MTTYIKILLLTSLFSLVLSSYSSLNHATKYAIRNYMTTHMKHPNFDAYSHNDIQSVYNDMKKQYKDVSNRVNYVLEQKSIMLIAHEKLTGSTIGLTDEKINSFTLLKEYTNLVHKANTNTYTKKTIKRCKELQKEMEKSSEKINVWSLCYENASLEMNMKKILYYTVLNEFMLDIKDDKMFSMFDYSFLELNIEIYDKKEKREQVSQCFKSLKFD